MSLDALRPCFNRKYKLDLESSKNFDEYMKAIGVSFMTRKLGVAVKPTVELTQEPDGRLTLSSKSSFKNVSISFNIGEEFDEITPDGRQVKSVVIVEGNKLIQTQKNGKQTVTIREFTPEKMIISSQTLQYQLFYAAEKDDLKTVKFLIEEKGAPVRTTNNQGETLVHIAAKNGNLDMVKYIVEKDPSFLTLEGKLYVRTALQVAVKHGALDVVKYLVETFRKDTVSDPKESDLETIIPLVFELGHLNILKYFIEEKNVNIDMPGQWQNQPPIFLAVEYQQWDILKYLVEESKANVTAHDWNDENILYVAVRRDDLATMKYLLDEKKIKFDVNSRNVRGETLVHKAALMNRISILEYLVDEKHAYINISDSEDNMNPLHFAAIGNHYESCKYLLEHGANVRFRDNTGQIPAEKTSDKRLKQLLNDEDESKRSRRSADVPVPYYSTFQPMSVTGMLSDVRRLGAKSFNDTSIYWSQLQNFLVVAGMIRIRDGKHVRYSKYRSFLSPPEILQNRIQETAVTAVDMLPDFNNA